MSRTDEAIDNFIAGLTRAIQRRNARNRETMLGDLSDQKRLRDKRVDQMRDARFAEIAGRNRKETPMKKVHTVGVVFGNGGSGDHRRWGTLPYNYLYDEEELGPVKVDDYVTIESHSGGPVVVKVVSVYYNTRVSGAFKYVIDRSNYALYLQRRKAQEDEARSAERVKQQALSNIHTLSSQMQHRKEQIRREMLDERAMEDPEYQSLNQLREDIYNQYPDLRANLKVTNYKG